MRQLLILLTILCGSYLYALDITVRPPAGVDKLYIAHYFLDGIRVVDSLIFKDSEQIWSADNQKEGIYFLTEGSQAPRFDFLLGHDQTFSITLNSFGVKSASIEGATSSVSFLAYQQYVDNKQLSANEHTAFLNNILSQTSDSDFLYLVAKALTPVKRYEQLPIMMQSGSIVDYNVSHYWDNVDLLDERINRTPFIIAYYDRYLKYTIPAQPEYMVHKLIPFFESIKQNTAFFEHAISKTLSFAVEDKIMGIDLLGYQLISKYYLSGAFGSLPPKQKDMLEDYVKHTKNCLLGNVAKEIRLTSWLQEEGEVSLLNIASPYVLVVFWEPDCEYCKEIIPHLRDDIYQKYANRGLSIFAVNTQREYEVWQSYILDNQLTDWTHGYLPVGTTNFMTDYGVQGTPYMFLLDTDKRILAKNVKLEFLDQMLTQLLTTGSIY